MGFRIVSTLLLIRTEKCSSLNRWTLYAERIKIKKVAKNKQLLLYCNQNVCVI